MYVCTFIRLLPSIPFVWHRPRGAQKLETWPGLLTAHRGRKRELLKELLVLGPWWEKLQMYQLKDAQSPICHHLQIQVFTTLAIGIPRQ